MTQNELARPFRFPVFVVLLAVMTMACAETQETHNTYTPVATSSLSRYDGLAYGHFSARVNAFIPNTADADLKIWVEGLPSGFTYNESSRNIEGDDPGAGVWNIKVCYTDRNKGVDGDLSRYYYGNFELRFFTKLEENAR
ncbi:hypothetical protein PLCT2_02704 [Planctomycetaceae bacterium]|nr:hypothetical protein PLCT2_02704 [Planctomycetaceae bacterium]